MSDQFRSDATLDQGDVDQPVTSERDAKIPSIAGGGLDPRKLGLAALVFGGLLFAALTFASGSNDGVAPPKPKADNPENVARYDPESVIAPTLQSAATDPSAPISLNAEQVPAIDNRQGATPTQSPQSAASVPQKSEAQVLREASRRSTLVAFGGEAGHASVRASASDTQSSNTDLDPSPARREPTTLDALRQGSIIERAQARSLGDRNFLIAAGSFIPCVLQTAMDSSQPGFVSCIVPRDIYSDNGRVILMEKGTKILGEYQAGLTRGQYRLFVLWNRAVTPRGIAIDVASPATDSLGRSGVSGRVNKFFWQRFGAALLFSLVEDAARVAGQAVGNQANNTTQVPSEAAGIILQDSQQIRPVLTKAQGDDVGITVARDFDFSSVYGLSLKQ